MNLFDEPLDPNERRALMQAQSSFLESQKQLFKDLAAEVEEKIPGILETSRSLHETYQPTRINSLVEIEGFEEFASFEFFYGFGKWLARSMYRPLSKIERISALASAACNDDTHDHETIKMLKLEKIVAALFNETIKVREEGILPYGKIVRDAYKRAIDQFKYFQKRYLNIGPEESRSYKNPWDEEKQSGFDLKSLDYIKIDPIKDNVMLTDILLDIAEKLPKQQVKKEKVKGKIKEKKFLNPFDLDRMANILVEIADPKYMWYITKPNEFLKRIADNITSYYVIMSSIDNHLRKFLSEFEKDHLTQIMLDQDFLNTTLPEPYSITERLRTIDYKQIKPSAEDTRPSNRLEKKYFAARKVLLEHLAETIDAIAYGHTEANKIEIAKNAIEKAIKLKEKLEKTLETKHKNKLKKDEKEDNEFYIGISGGLGEFQFKREPAPRVRLKDVYGESFEAMKEHIADLANYSKFLHLYSATAPRGRVRSNLIAIGPYGCGKTEIGRAIAGDPRFIGAEISITDLLTCWFGEFEKNVDRVWDAAKELRRDSGESKLVFLLMDEFDSWFNASSGYWVDSTYQRVQKALQMKLDGVVDYEGIITVGFTNEPKKIPLAIYRRFKYVDIVGELNAQERADLLKKFLTTGLPVSSGFKAADYTRWGEMLDGATGDVVGKVTDDIHYQFMRKFIQEHPIEGRKINAQIRRMQSRENKEIDKRVVKRAMGRLMQVTPDWVEQKVKEKLAEPIIKEQIETAKRVYAEAREVLSNLQSKKDTATGNVCQ